ncbi:hypothetical protein WPAU_0264 [Wolbachia endosymbiont of Drosophila simulans wAu]|nr:hypothetical protein WPAU_0264 [Wolbachia endosymbiont of Drosophila simulans wAu]
MYIGIFCLNNSLMTLYFELTCDSSRITLISIPRFFALIKDCAIGFEVN